MTECLKFSFLGQLEKPVCIGHKRIMLEFAANDNEFRFNKLNKSIDLQMGVSPFFNLYNSISKPGHKIFFTKQKIVICKLLTLAVFGSLTIIEARSIHTGKKLNGLSHPPTPPQLFPSLRHSKTALHDSFLCIW